VPSTDTHDALLELDPTGRVVHRWPNGAESIALDATGTTMYQTFVEPGIVRAVAVPDR
jgi:hypothetical protein